VRGCAIGPEEIMILLSKTNRAVALVWIGVLSACMTDASSSRLPADERLGRVSSAVSASAVTYAGDELRTGWYDDEAALDPATVGGGSFGQLFSTNITGQVYAQPLVSQGTLFVATEANTIYGLNATTGAQIWSRTLGAPFSSTDIGCSNVAPNIGITGTPVIDSATNIAYFFSKAYVSGTSGTVAYFAHGVSVATGSEVTGFPVRIEGTAANDTTQTFTAHQQLQRPGVLLMGGVVYAAFGGHCDKRPYTGWIAGVSTAGQLKTLWTTMAGPSKSDGGGIWMPSAIASDGAGQILIETGNGYGSISSSTGKPPPATLPESAVRLVVQSDGSLKATDFFSPFDAGALDGSDLDFGSSGPLALPSPAFGTTTFPHLLVTGSKKGYVYLLNRDSLGGRGQGASGGDAALVRLGPFGGAWTKPSAWPGDGGYIYITDSQGGGQGLLRAFKYGVDGLGNPTLSLSATSADAFGYGSGPPMVTSNGTASGSALVWVEFSTGPGSSGGELRAYDAVPMSGSLHKRWSAPIGTVSNFAAPGIAGGRVYIASGDGNVRGFGAPVSAALSGSPVAFGTVTVGQSKTLTATLTASRAVTVTALSSSNAQFTLGVPSPTLPASLAAQATLALPVTFTPTAAGLVGGTLDVTSSAGPFSISLSGTGQSSAAQITASTPSLSFGGTAVGTTITGSVTFTNTGGAPLTVTGATLPSAPFTVSGLPASGSSMASGAAFTATVSFSPTATGSFTSSFALLTSVGSATVGLTGSAAPPGILTITPLSVAFGNVAVGSNVSQSFTVANTGGSPLTISKSKPPALGQFVATSTLAEGTVLAASTSKTETVSFTPTVLGASSDGWVFNSTVSSTTTTVTFAGTGVQGTTSSLVLQYLCADTNPTDNSIKPHFNIVNNGSASVPLSGLTIRYWYTITGSPAQVFACDYAPIGCSNISASFASVSRTHADEYFQVSFGSGAGSIAANGQTGEMQLRFNKTDWSAFNQSGDYSFDPTKTTLTAWSHVTLYQNGTLIAGTEP
jgi:hypothetical protein